MATSWSRRCCGTVAVRSISSSVRWRGMWRKWAPESIPSRWAKMIYRAQWKINQEDYFIFDSLCSALSSSLLQLPAYSYTFLLNCFIASVSISEVLHINFWSIFLNIAFYVCKVFHLQIPLAALIIHIFSFMKKFQCLFFKVSQIFDINLDPYMQFLFSACFLSFIGIPAMPALILEQDTQTNTPKYSY